MRPLSLLSVSSRKSTDSQRSTKRSSLLSIDTTSSQHTLALQIPVDLPNLQRPPARSPSDSGDAEMLDDDNLAWGSPVSPKSARRRSRFWS